MFLLFLLNYTIFVLEKLVEKHKLSYNWILLLLILLIITSTAVFMLILAPIFYYYYINKIECYTSEQIRINLWEDTPLNLHKERKNEFLSSSYNSGIEWLDRNKWEDKTKKSIIVLLHPWQPFPNFDFENKYLLKSYFNWDCYLANNKCCRCCMPSLYSSLEKSYHDLKEITSDDFFDNLPRRDGYHIFNRIVKSNIDLSNIDIHNIEFYKKCRVESFWGFFHNLVSYYNLNFNELINEDWIMFYKILSGQYSLEEISEKFTKLENFIYNNYNDKYYASESDKFFLIAKIASVLSSEKYILLSVSGNSTGFLFLNDFECIYSICKLGLDPDHVFEVMSKENLNFLLNDDVNFIKFLENLKSDLKS